MVHHLEAVFEDGILRPTEPLALAEHQRVKVTIDDLAPLRVEEVAEMAWLEAHGNEFIGQWVALDGDRLVAHGADALSVREEARRQGVQVPLMHRPSARNEDPQAFWI